MSKLYIQIHILNVILNWGRKLANCMHLIWKLKKTIQSFDHFTSFNYKHNTYYVVRATYSVETFITKILLFLTIKKNSDVFVDFSIEVAQLSLLLVMYFSFIWDSEKLINLYGTRIEVKMVVHHKSISFKSFMRNKIEMRSCILCHFVWIYQINEIAFL